MCLEGDGVCVHVDFVRLTLLACFIAIAPVRRTAQLADRAIDWGMYAR
jgi:hypothetical protein